MFQPQQLWSAQNPLAPRWPPGKSSHKRVVRSRKPKLAATDLQQSESAAIARGLHSDIAQAAVMLELRISRIQNTIGQGASNLDGQLTRLRQETSCIAARLRHIGYRLDPATLESVEPRTALGELFAEFALTHAGPARFRCRLVPQRIPAAVIGALYVAAGEILRHITQCSRHANVQLLLSDRQSCLFLSIEVAGIAVDRAQPKFSSHFANSEARVRQIGGTFSVQAAPGKGVRVAIEVPASASYREP